MQRLDDDKKKRIIDNAVEMGMAGRKKSGEWKKRLAVVAVVVIIGIPAFGFAFPSVAANIPLIGGLFDRVDLHGQDRLAGLSDYATVIGETQVSDGVSVTLSEAFFDGREVYLTFLVESDDDISNAFMFNMESANAGLIVDGDELCFSGSISRDYHAIDDYSFLFILAIAIMGTDIEDEGAVEAYLNLSQLMGIDIDTLETYGYEDTTVLAEGPWNFRIPLESIPVESSARSVVHQTINHDGFDVTIYDLITSPVGTTVNFSYIAPFYTFPHEPAEIDGVFEATTAQIEWELVDNLGNVVHALGGGVSMEYYSAEGSFSIEPPHSDATQLIITPVAYIWHYTITHDIEERERIRGEAAGGSWESTYINEERALIGRIELEEIVIDLP